jgi:hypothetical protein
MERNETPFCHRQSTPQPRFSGVCRSSQRQNERIMSPKTGTPAAATEWNRLPSNELADVARRGPPTKCRNPRAPDPDVARRPHCRRQNRETNAAAIRETKLAKTGAKTGAGIYVGYQSSAQEVILVNMTITENVAFKGPRLRDRHRVCRMTKPADSTSSRISEEPAFHSAWAAERHRCRRVGAGRDEFVMNSAPCVKSENLRHCRSPRPCRSAS